MAPVKKRDNRKQNIKKSQRNKAKNKSKYFNKTQINDLKQAGKSTTTQKAQECGKRNNLPNSEQFAVNGSETFNPPVLGTRLTRDFFDAPAETLAVALLGKILCRQIEPGVTLRGRIVETEAYLGVIDPACHAYGGKRTARNEPMYGPPGTAYVYFIYGMYHCFNISSKEGGACVLIRALEPLAGLDHMRELRSVKRQTSKPLKEHELANGPSKLCTAMDITKDKLNNTDMAFSNQFWVEDTSSTGFQEFSIVHTTRIGINSYGKEAAEKLYRYYILGSKNVSVRNKIAENKLEEKT